MDSARVMVSTQAGHLLKTRNEDVHEKGGFWSQSPPAEDPLAQALQAALPDGL